MYYLLAHVQVKIDRLVQKGYIAPLYAERNKKKLTWFESARWLMRYGGYKVLMCKKYRFRVIAQVEKGPAGLKRICCTSIRLKES